MQQPHIVDMRPVKAAGLSLFAANDPVALSEQRREAYRGCKEWLEAEQCTCPAKDMPFGRCCKASDREVA